MRRVLEWLCSLDTELVPLTRRERSTVVVLAVVTALSRFLALARTPWDWDEMLFCLSLRLYSVYDHRPHPPGFPIYVLLGKIVNRIGVDAFHSFQVVNLICAVALFPLMFAFARELRARTSLAIAAAAFLSFFPNVWFFGGTAFSDIPSLAFVLAAVALLLRGCRSERAYLAGAVMLGLAAGIRAQSLAIGFAP